MPYTDIYKPLEFFGDRGTLTRIFDFWCSFSTIGTLRPLALQFGCATTRWWWCATTQNQQCWDRGGSPQVSSTKKATSKTKSSLNSLPQFNCYFQQSISNLNLAFKALQGGTNSTTHIQPHYCPIHTYYILLQPHVIPCFLHIHRHKNSPNMSCFSTFALALLICLEIPQRPPPFRYL